MSSKIMEVIAERIPLLGSALLISLLAVVLQRLLKADPLSHVPFAGAELGDKEKRLKAYMTGAKGLYIEGYKKFKNSMYRITAPRASPTLVVSPKFLPELSALPDSVVSVTDAIMENMHAKYTKLVADEPIGLHTIKSKLTPSLTRLNPILSDEVANTIRLEMPACKDWTEVNIHSTLLRIVAQVSGRIFLGPELCHDEAYIHASINYSVDLIKSVMAVNAVPAWKRRFKASSLPEIQAVRKHEAAAVDFLRPVVAARLEGERNDPNYVKPDDMLQWFLDDYHGLRDAKELAKIQLMMSFAALHTTTTVSTNAFYNLATRPELVDELREEIRTVLAQHGNQWTTAALQQMKKFDSMLKETLRCNGLSWASYSRKVIKPVTLSNGQVIPPGTMIEIPQVAVYADPDIYPEPEKFDALRYYRMRMGQDEEKEKKKASGTAKHPVAVVDAHHQFVSVNTSSLTFGYGRHACPGRFFAANEIKMILGRILLTYDVRNVGESKERYKNFEVGAGSIPDPTKNLLFKAI